MIDDNVNEITEFVDRATGLIADLWRQTTGQAFSTSDLFALKGTLKTFCEPRLHGIGTKVEAVG